MEDWWGTPDDGGLRTQGQLALYHHQTLCIIHRRRVRAVVQKPVGFQVDRVVRDQDVLLPLRRGEPYLQSSKDIPVQNSQSVRIFRYTIVSQHKHSSTK